MSMFLPEVPQGAQQPEVSSFSQDAAQSSQEDIALMKRVLSVAAANPLAVPEGFWQAALEYIQVNRLTLPISQVFGYGQNVRTTALVINGSQSIPNSVATKIAFASATYDPSAMWDGNTGLTAPTTGMYAVTWSGQIAATIAYQAGLAFGFTSGGTFAGAGSGFVNVPFTGAYAPGSVVQKLTKGDKFSLYATQSSGAPVSFIGLSLSLALITAL